MEIINKNKDNFFNNFFQSVKTLHAYKIIK